MEAVRQHTVKSPVEFSGIGLHTGEKCSVTVRPAQAGAGISFRRCDLSAANNIILAKPGNVVHTDHGTVLGNSASVSVATVEHLMAALALCGVDNAIIDVVGPETPILDGSASPFVNALKQTGFVAQSRPRGAIVIKETIAVDEGDRSILIEPHDSFAIDIAIDFEDCLIGQQSMQLHFGDSDDHERLARSRTFCRLQEVEALRGEGLIRGGSLENSLVVDGDQLLNVGPLRDPEEFVLHKALDLIGDLYLLGAPIYGKVKAEKPGHDLNTRLAQAIAGELALAAVPDERLPIAASA